VRLLIGLIKFNCGQTLVALSWHQSASRNQPGDFDDGGDIDTAGYIVWRKTSGNSVSCGSILSSAKLLNGIVKVVVSRKGAKAPRIIEAAGKKIGALLFLRDLCVLRGY
jgi:hypothetical protein